MGGDDEVVAVNEEVAHGGVGQVVLEQPPVVAVVESTESSTSLCRRAWSGVLGAPLPALRWYGHQNELCCFRCFQN